GARRLAGRVRRTTRTVPTYPKNDGVHVRITDKGDDATAVMARIEAMDALIRGRVGEYVWGTDADTLGALVGRALTQRGWRIAVIEAITGGDIARALTDTAGSAVWFAGAIVLPEGDEPALA